MAGKKTNIIFVQFFFWCIAKMCKILYNNSIVDVANLNGYATHYVETKLAKAKRV